MSTDYNLRTLLIFQPSSPGLVETEMTEQFPSDIREAIFEQAKNTLPVGHIGTPEEVAEAYIFAMRVSRGFTGLIARLLF